MINYKVSKKGIPGVIGRGSQKYYVTTASSSLFTLRKLVTQISKRTTLNITDVIATLESFLEIIPKYLEEGDHVKLGAFGMFRVSLKSKARDKEEDVFAENIIGNKIIFTSILLVKNTLKIIEYKKLS